MMAHDKRTFRRNGDVCRTRLEQYTDIANDENITRSMSHVVTKYKDIHILNNRTGTTVVDMMLRRDSFRQMLRIGGPTGSYAATYAGFW